MSCLTPPLSLGAREARVEGRPGTLADAAAVSPDLKEWADEDLGAVGTPGVPSAAGISFDPEPVQRLPVVVHHLRQPVVRLTVGPPVGHLPDNPNPQVSGLSTERDSPLTAVLVADGAAPRSVVIPAAGRWENGRDEHLP